MRVQSLFLRLLGNGITHLKLGYRLAYNGDVAAVETYRRISVSAFAKHHQLLRDLLVIIAVSKSSLTSPDADTPIRRPADTLPLAAHFERNDIPIICETVHTYLFWHAISLLNFVLIEEQHAHGSLPRGFWWFSGPGEGLRVVLQVCPGLGDLGFWA
jgi:hypothetical protein